MIERLLRAHFVRRFLENDLISPDADRHDVMAMLAAVLLSGGLFVTFLMGFKYLTMVYQSPGRTAVGAISDRLFLYGSSMEAMALAALLSWNALSLDARDVAILGTLPITRRTMVRAKLASVMVVAASFGLALNAVTGFLYPVLLVGKLKVSLAATAEMVAAHAGVGLAAGAFGFLAVLAAREVLHALVGSIRFARVSVAVHASLTVTVMVSLLLLPGMSSSAAERWLAKPSPVRWVVPPLWFVGLHERIMGERLAKLPYEPLPRFIAAYEARVAAIYTRARPTFPGLAATAVAGLALLALVALPAYWWNNRRVDASGPPLLRARRRPLFARLARGVNGTIVRHPVAQAGFWLALRAVTRSLPHRMSMAFAVAVAVATLMVGLPLAWNAPVGDVPLAALAPQLVALGALAVGFRHAVGVPADLRASWLFRVAWLGDTNYYLAGVRRFAIVGLILPLAVLLIPVHAAFLGVRAAAAQALAGSLIAAVLLRALLATYERLPFATPHAPSGTLNTRGPVYLFGTIAVVYGLAWLVRAALHDWRVMGALSATALSAYALLGLVERRRLRSRPAIDLEDLPDDVTQRLGLA